MSKYLKLFFLALAICVSAAWAGDFEDGVAAHEKKDFATALRKYKSAAAQGNAGAQLNLGVMYNIGQGVVQDYMRAHIWFNLAAVTGNADAVKNRDSIAKQMTPQQIAEAQKLARECQARNFKNCD